MENSTPMYLTFKYRIYPTAAQRTSLLRALDACRWVYNKALEARKTAWEEQKERISQYDTSNLIPAWRAEHPFLADAYSQCLQNACFRVDLAFQGFFRRVRAGQKPGYPRFRGKGRYDSLTYPQYGNGAQLKGDRLALGKVGRVRIKLHRPPAGTVKMVTIRRDGLGNWYAHLLCKIEPSPLPTSSEVVGVDLGLKTFAMLSTGEAIPRHRWMKQDAKDIARLQRKKEQYAKGSPERRKVIRALNHAYRRAANRRADFAHQESRKLINRFGVVAFEDLNIAGMQSNGDRAINRSIADVAWGQFVECATYKAASAGRIVLRVDPKGTTQECSGCGAIVPKDLSVRVHDCPRCGLKLDRDLNAALNILARGVASLRPDR